MKKSSEIEQIDLLDLIKDFKVKDLNTFSRYLVEIWRDLSKRSSEQSKGIDKITFSHYYELPGIICDRLFCVFDKNQDGFLDSKEFIEGMTMLFSENFKVLVEFIFKFYDMNHDGFITKEDVRVALSYVPLQIKASKNKMSLEKEEFKDRVESQDELFEILSKSFGKKEKLSQDDFINVIENISSDIFIFILMFILEKKPFSEESIQIFLRDKRVSKECRTPQMQSHKIASPSLKSKLVSPSLKRRSIKVAENKNILSLYSGVGPKGPIPIKIEADESKKEDTKGKEEAKGKIPHRRTRKKLGGLEDDIPKSKDFAFSVSKGKETEKLIVNETEQEEAPPLVQHEGYMYKITHSKKLKQVYFKLIGKDFYYFKNNGDSTYKGMHNLSGIYIKEIGPTVYEGKKLFSFSILYPNKTRTYYIEQEAQYNEWIKKLNLAINFKSLLDQYEIKEKVGRGKFGLVKLAKHKETGKLVAIKIMSKKEMTVQDLELAKTEIDILKVCQHPNIIKLYDVFYTAESIYIVMEYCGGGDLFSYIEKRGFKLPEPKACEIIHKLSMAIFYVHSYGIVHRDLKPENILMTDTSDNADIRLLDFGLSKIIGPNEKCKEPYGTLSYVAPEVLKEKPYDKAVDLWSIGIIAYLLLCGFLPFDDENSEREIARQTVQDPVPYPGNAWNKLSNEAKKFVDGLLKKSPESRMTLTQVLEHEWIKKFTAFPDSRLKKEKKKKSLFSLYTTIDGITEEKK